MVESKSASHPRVHRLVEHAMECGDLPAQKQVVELSLAASFLRLKIRLNRFEILPRHRVR